MIKCVTMSEAPNELYIQLNEASDSATHMNQVFFYHIAYIRESKRAGRVRD